MPFPCALYLVSQSDETCSVAAWPTLEELLIRPNTPLPAVVRLWSVCSAVQVLQ
jgi:hypothetical protein